MAPLVRIINGKKTFTVLENNPEVMNALSSLYGLSSELQWTDIYSLTSPDLLSLIPRPIFALLAIIPLTPTWATSRETEDASTPTYPGKGPNEEILWFKQTIGNACGTYGLIHSLLNSPASSYIKPNSILSRIRRDAAPLGMVERAKLLYDDEELEVAHQSVGEMGDTIPPDSVKKCGLHFVAFVVKDRKLWELEGGRKGPIFRGDIEEGEDLLSERVVEMGLGGIIRREVEGGGGDLRFSVIGLVKADGGEV